MSLGITISHIEDKGHDRAPDRKQSIVLPRQSRNKAVMVSWI